MAASTLMTLLVKLGLDTSEFDGKIGGVEKKAKGSASSILSAFSGIGGAVVAGAAATGAAAAGLLISSIKPASDLGESINAVNKVFGEGSYQILEYGKTAAYTVGLSNREFNSLATTTGAFLQNVGFSADDAAGETINLTKRAADMASVFNTDVSTALNAIQSGLKGEFNPLEQFGVKLNAAAIEAKAMSMGLADSKNELTDSHKAAAALELMYEQTAKTQGDFIDTSDGLANGQRTLAGVFENVKAKLGTALMPAIEKVMKLFTEFAKSKDFKVALEKITTAIGDFAAKAAEKLPLIIDALKRGFGWLMENEGVITAVLAVIGVAIVAFAITAAGALWSMMAPMLPIIAVVLLVAGVAYLLYQAWTTNFGGIRDKLLPIFEAIKTWLGTAIPAAVTFLTGLWNGTLVPAFEALWSMIQTYVLPVIAQIVSFFQVAIPMAITFLVNIFNNILVPAFMVIWGFISEYILPLFAALGELIGVTVVLAVTALSVLWSNVLQPAIEAVWKFIKEKLMPIFDKLMEQAADKLTPALDFVKTVFLEIKTAIDIVIEVIDKVIGAIKGLIEWLQKIKVPPGLQLGSPPPLAIGVMWVTDSMKDLKHELQGVTQDLNYGMPANFGKVTGSQPEQQPFPTMPSANEIGKAIVYALAQTGVL
jgi:hypothetical protein